MSAYLLAILLTTLVIVDATPQCITYNVGDVVCTAGSMNYKLERGLVSDNNRTTGITLRACRIVDVDFDAFKGLNSLKYLDLSINMIQKLKLGVLDEPKQLTYLNLSYNQLTEFPLLLFDELHNLDLIDLKGNKINKLQTGLFNPLPKLKFVDLSSNAFSGKDLDSDLFAHSPHITFMDFSRNDMNGAPDNLLSAFLSLEFLNLDRCFLSRVPEFTIKPNLKTMKHLILSTNQISNLDNPTLFINLDNLEELDLTSNVIESINGNIFSPLKKLQKIVLRNNKIKTIPDNLFRNMPKLITIHLYGNQITNVPINAFRGTPLKNLNLSNNKITYLQDNFCQELRNSGGNLKKFLFEPNPWQCACLNDLLKEVKSLGIEYNSAKYNGKDAVCVTTNEFTCKRQQNANEIYIDMYNEISV